MTVKYRNLGSLEVSVLGLGRVAVTGSYAAPVDRTDMIRLIHEAYGRDVNFFDTVEASQNRRSIWSIDPEDSRTLTPMSTS